MITRDRDASINDISWSPSLYDLSLSITNPTYDNDLSKSFIAASLFDSDASAVITKTDDIDYSVMKGFIVNYGDVQSYRFRIRAVNDRHKVPGIVSSKYSYVRPIGRPTDISVSTYLANDTEYQLDNSGFYSVLQQDIVQNKYVIKCVVSASATEHSSVQSTLTTDYQTKIHFKGYFIEYQSVDVSDASVNNPIHSQSPNDLRTNFNNASWKFVQFVDCSNGILK